MSDVELSRDQPLLRYMERFFSYWPQWQDKGQFEPLFHYLVGQGSL